MAVEYPVPGHWYRNPNGSLFEVVAVDEDDATVEVQHFDGTLDEIDLEAWPALVIEAVDAPEDWSGAIDMDPEDFVGKEQADLPAGWHDPLDFLDRTE
jgi:hypothetical protein